ncbi:hypothetical protein ACLK1Y_03775 [Escherichia coli]
MRPQLHPVPADASGRYGQVATACGSAGSFRNAAGSRCAAARGSAITHGQHKDRYAGETLRQLCQEMQDLYARHNVKQLQKEMFRKPTSHASA